MVRPTVILTLDAAHDLAGELAAGGLRVPRCELARAVECELVVRAEAAEVRLAARVAEVGADGDALLELTAEGAELARGLAALARLADAVAARAGDVADAGEPGPAAGVVAVADRAGVVDAAVDGVGDRTGADEAVVEGEDVDGAAAGARGVARNVQERLRNLTLAQQVRVAQKGHLHERIVLERMYGKTVWEALLRNPALTGPEVARIARMGALPRPLIELIVDHGGWLQIPEVRRALLSNPRLGTDQILRVLRLLPRPELRLAASQTAYPYAVRDAARRLVREE